MEVDNERDADQQSNNQFLYKYASFRCVQAIQFIVNVSNLIHLQVHKTDICIVTSMLEERWLSLPFQRSRCQHACSYFILRFLQLHCFCPLPYRDQIVYKQ